MDQQQEKKVLQALYDRLFDAITYQPEGAKNPFTVAESFIHFSKGSGVNVASFEDALSPTNNTGSLATLENFSIMVDKVSPMSLEWNPAGKSLANTYKNIVESANSIADLSPDALKRYEKALNYLRPEVTKVNPFDDTAPPIVSREESEDYRNYQINLAALTTAIQNYRNTFNTYFDDFNSDDPNVVKKAEREWMAKAPMLEQQINLAQLKLTGGNADFVEMALNIMATSLNDGVGTVITDAQKDVAEEKFFPSLTGQGNYMPAYAFPDNWYAPEAAQNFSSFKFSNKNIREISSATQQRYNADTSLDFGLFRFGARVNGETSESSRRLDASNLEISANIGRVDIVRPWFNELLFSVGGWYTNLGNGDDDKNYISNGKIDSSNRQKLLPMYPVSFIVARDISIKADFSSEDEKHIRKAFSGGGSASFGPFSIGGNYSYGKKEDRFNGSYQNGEIRVPGVQIIGWVSRVVPGSPVLSKAEADRIMADGPRTPGRPQSLALVEDPRKNSPKPEVITNGYGTNGKTRIEICLDNDDGKDVTIAFNINL